MIARTLSCTIIIVLSLLANSVSLAVYVGATDMAGSPISDPPSMQEFREMAEHRVEKHACMQRGIIRQQEIQDSRLFLLDYYPTANMYDYDVLFYRIDIEIDMDEQATDGYVEMVARSNVDGLSYIDLNFSSVPTVFDVTLDGVSQAFSHIGELISVNLSETFNTDEEFTINVFYGGDAQTTFSGGMYFRDYNGLPVVFTDCEPFGARYWWPCKDFTFDKPDSVDIIITHPAQIDGSNADCVSNGVLVSKTGNGQTTTSHWFEKHPIATYLVAFSLTDFHEYSQSWEYAPGEFMPVDHFYFPACPPDNPSFSTYYMVDATLPALDALSSFFGTYPWVDEKYGHMHWDFGGAMEHQTCTSIGANFNTEYVICHELGHQWAGDKVTCNTFNHIWLNEGFASYMEVLHFEYRYGWSYAKTWLGYQKHINAGTPYVEDIETDAIFDGITVYDKGSWLVHMLRRQMGDSLFFPAMQYYFFDSKFADSSASTEDLNEVVSQFYGSDMSWFFDAWVYQEGQPNYKYSYMYEPDSVNGGQLLSIYLAQENSDGIFPMHVPIAIHAGGDDTTITVWNAHEGDLFQLNVYDWPVTLEIDPDEDILRTVEQVSFTMHITANELPRAYQGYSYNYTFGAVGGQPPYEFQITSGSLPDGLSFDQQSAMISGVPTATGDYAIAVLCTDSDAPQNTEEREYTLSVTELQFVRGDCDKSGGIDIDDVVFLITYIFGSGPAPDPIEAGDVNCSGGVDIDDVVYLIEYIFGAGPAPC
jgi:aminopeptidase N